MAGTVETKVRKNRNKTKQLNLSAALNEGKLRYADKEKALAYISSPAPIAGATNKQGLNSAAKVIENFENPKISNETSNNAIRSIDKIKALNYLHHSAPIAEALSSSRLNSVAKVIENFENPKISNEILQKLAVYHGSPYSFKAFYYANLGNGEGGQAHG